MQPQAFVPHTPLPSLSGEMPLFIVFNAASGSGDKQQRRSDIEGVLTEAGRHHEFFFAERSEDVEACAHQAVAKAAKHEGAVVVAGGDGTINLVAALTLPTRRPFGLLPQGTFNYSCRTHGIPLDTIAATRALLHARVKPIQVGRVNDRLFLVNASLGLYPKLLEDRETFKKEFGRKRAVALVAGLITIFRYRRQLTLEIDHDGQQEVVRTPTLFVGNNALQLDQVGLPEASDVKLHKLAAVVVQPGRSAAMLGLVLRGAIGKLRDAPNIRDFAFTSMIVRNGGGQARRLIKVATDGEICRMQTPLRFRIDPQPLMLMVPSTLSEAVTP